MPKYKFQKLPVLCHQPSANNGFTLIEVLISLIIFGIVATLVIPNFRRQTQSQEYLNSVAEFKSALKEVQSSYQSGTKCSNLNPTSGWELRITKSGATTTYLKRCYYATTYLDLPPTTLPTITQITGSTCTANFTQINLVFNKSGLSYTCTVGGSTTNSPASFNTFDFSFQNSNLTSQVSTVKISQQGVVTE